ncbi:uncharacterized protein LTR77_000762 [Saxophila tyrrhenica]|uniref:Uncharacterized protein n=1 Tax=Saxophila tyrrhenica TaxID=1690608 RepID=A0AAV9PQV7_9PEZI|nr:hypothetical protein LTR77_000762 [Saxophila tyrrhenica]
MLGKPPETVNNGGDLQAEYMFRASPPNFLSFNNNLFTSTATATTMAPKKSTTRAAAPTRRSARLASRETSVEASASEPEQAAGLLPPSLLAPVVKGPLQVFHSGSAPVSANGVSASLARWCVSGFISTILRNGETYKVRVLTREQVDDVAEQLFEQLEQARDEAKEANDKLRRARPSIRRDFGLAQISANYQAKQRLLSESTEKQPAEPAEPSAPSVPSVPAAPSPLSAAPTTATPPQPVRVATPPSLLSRAFGWFSRKRPAEEEAEEPEREAAREPKRPRIEAPRPSSPALSQPVEEVVDSSSGTSPERATENSGGDNNVANSTTTTAGSSRGKKRVRVEEPEAATPRATFPPSPRDWTGPSAKNPRQPTSLSTINEYSEPTHTTILEDSTPSRPSRSAPSRGLQAPQNTPAIKPRRSVASPSPSSSTFSNLSTMPQSTPFLMRRSAANRLAKRAAANSTPKPFAWARDTPRPREPNADARLEKIQRIRALEKQLQELKSDDDVKDIEAHSIHRRKRVKIDDLAVIPHNRPGDSSGTFRVPDYDSDEEIEVDSDCMDLSGNSNIFDDAEKAQQSTQAQQVTEPSTTSRQSTRPAALQVTEPAQSSTTPGRAQVTGQSSSSTTPGTAQVTGQPQQQATAPQASMPQAQAPSFSFPSVDASQSHQATQPQASMPQEQMPTYNFPQARPSHQHQQQATEPETSSQQQQTPSFSFPQAGQSKQLHDQATEPQAASPHAQMPILNFPVVAWKPADYEEPSEEYKAAAGRDFTEGFNKWLAAHA